MHDLHEFSFRSSQYLEVKQETNIKIFFTGLFSHPLSGGGGGEGGNRHVTPLFGCICVWLNFSMFFCVCDAF